MKRKYVKKLRRAARLRETVIKVNGVAIAAMVLIISCLSFVCMIQTVRANVYKKSLNLERQKVEELIQKNNKLYEINGGN